MALSWWPVQTFPRLASNNYDDWSVQMETFLGGQELWDAIEDGFESMLAAAMTEKAQRETRARDKRALFCLQCSIDDANFDKIAEIENAKPAWEILQKAHQSVDEKEKKKRKEEAQTEEETGNAAYKRKEFEKAIGGYTKAIELDDEDISFFTNRAAVYLEMGKYDECIQDCDKAIERGRELRSDYKMIARALFARALTRKGTALAKMAKSSKDYGVAIEFFQKALTEHRNPDTLKKLNDAERAKKELEQQEYYDPQIADEDDESLFGFDVEVLEVGFVVKGNLPEEGDEDDDFDGSKELHQCCASAMSTRHDAGVDHEVLDEENSVDEEAVAVLRKCLEHVEKELKERTKEIPDCLATIKELEAHVKEFEDEIELQRQTVEAELPPVTCAKFYQEFEMRKLEDELERCSKDSSENMGTIMHFQTHFQDLEEELEKTLEKQTKELHDDLQTTGPRKFDQELEIHVGSLEEELDKQAQKVESYLEVVTRAKVEQEQLAIRAEETLRLMRFGKKNKDVTKFIQKVVAAYDCKIVEDVLSDQLKQLVIDGNKVVLSVSTPEVSVDDAEFEENEVYAVNIVASTGEGKPKLLDEKLQLKAANQLSEKKADSDVSQGEREGSFAVDPGGESEELIKRQEEEKSCPVDTVISNLHSTEVGSGTGLETLNSKQVVAEDYRSAESEKIPQNGNTGAELPLNCDDYSSTVALENFGMEKLQGIIDEGDVLVFASKKTTVDEMEKQFLQRGFRIVALHGDQDQASCMEILQWQGRAGSFMRSNEHGARESDGTVDTSWHKGMALKLVQGDQNAKNWWSKLEVVRDLVVRDLFLGTVRLEGDPYSKIDSQSHMIDELSDDSVQMLQQLSDEIEKARKRGSDDAFRSSVFLEKDSTAALGGDVSYVVLTELDDKFVDGQDLVQDSNELSQKNLQEMLKRTADTLSSKGSDRNNDDEVKFSREGMG